MKLLVLNIVNPETGVVVDTINPPAGSGVIGSVTDHGKHILSTGITVVLIFAVILALFALIFGGVRWMTSGGDPKAVESARSRIIQAVIGLVIIFLSFAIMAFLSKVFNVQLLGI